MRDRPADHRPDPDNPDNPDDTRLEAWLALDRLSALERARLRHAVVTSLEARARRRQRLFHLSLVPAAAAGILLGVLLARALLVAPPLPPHVPVAGPVESKRPDGIAGQPGRVARSETPSPAWSDRTPGPQPARPGPAIPLVSAMDRTASMAPVGHTTAVHGIVVNARGEPVTEARVSGLGDMARVTAAVDPTGHFVLRLQPENPLSSFLRVIAPAGRHLRDLVVRHEPGAALQLRVESGHYLEGRVVDQETGQRLHDAQVTLAVYWHDRILHREDAQSHASGFQLSPLPRFRSLALDRAGSEPEVSALEDVSFTLTAYRPGYVTAVRVFPSEEALEQTLQKPLGLWPGGQLEVQVTTPSGRPLPGALVHLRPIRVEPAVAAGSVFTYRARRGPRTDATGTVRFEGIPPGQIQVVAIHPGARPVPGKEVAIAARHTTKIRLTLRPGKQLHGQVTDEAGRPIPGAVVYAIPAGSGENAPVQAHGPWLTGSDGRFLGLGLAPGHYDLHVFHPVPVSREGVRRVVPGVPTGQMNRAIALRRSAVELVLDVRDARTGAPLPGAEVILLGPGGRALRKPRPGPDGRLWIRGVDPSRTAVQVRAPGYLPSSIHRLSLPVGSGVHPVEIRLYRPSLLEGVVVDRHGQPVVGALVAAGREEVEPIRPDRRAFHSAGFLRTATTDPNGRFTLSELRVQSGPGLTFELTVLCPGQAPVTLQGPTLLQGESLEGVVIRLP